MSKITPVISDFTRGELSPRMEGRSDSEAFYQGVSELRNMIVLPQGGIEKRPGTVYFDSAKYAVKKSRLVPFVFDDNSVYILEFYDGGVRPILVENGTRQFVTSIVSINLDVPPASDWPAGSVITGATSGAKSTILQKTSSLVYKIDGVDGTFALGEVIEGVDADGAANNADQGGAHPTISTSTVATPVLSHDGAAFYSEEDLPQFKYVQAGAQMVFACPTKTPKILNYFSETGWLWADVKIRIPLWQDGRITTRRR